MAKTKIDPLNKTIRRRVRHAYGRRHSGRREFLSEAFGFTKRGIMSGPDGTTNAC